MHEEIDRLRRDGLSIRAISELTGYDRKTVRKYLQVSLDPSAGDTPLRPGKLDPFKPFLEGKLKDGVWNARVLLRDLRQRGYEGGYTLLTDWLRPVREGATAAAMRQWEAAPGEQACAEWGRLDRVDILGTRRQLWCFTVTLAYSRAMCAVATLDEKLPTLLRVHEEAFRQLGGIPRRIRYGRFRTLWLDTVTGGEAEWNPVFLDFARHWNFCPELDRSHLRKSLRQVPLGVRYVRRNWTAILPSEPVTGIEAVNSHLAAWIAQVPNQRFFQASQCRVQDRWLAEKSSLSPLQEKATYPYCVGSFSRDLPSRRAAQSA